MARASMAFPDRLKRRVPRPMPRSAGERCRALGIVALLMLLGRGVNADPIAVARPASTTLDFEGLTDNEVMLGDYGGLHWANFFALNNQTAVPPDFVGGYKSGATSGSVVAFGFNAQGQRAAISGPSFTFNSGNFTAAFRTNLRLIVFGEGSGQTHVAKLTLNPFAPTLFAPNWTGIDRLEFAPTGGTEALPRSGSGSNFVLDDFTFTGAATTTPEPTPLLMLVTAALAGILLMRPGAS